MIFNMNKNKTSGFFPIYLSLIEIYKFIFILVGARRCIHLKFHFFLAKGEL